MDDKGFWIMGAACHKVDLLKILVKRVIGE